MGIERERKFILKTLPNLEGYEKKIIIQKYLGTKPELRVRKIGEKFIITKKGEGTHTRREEEMEISERLFRFLEGYEEEKSIKKVRHYVPLTKGLIAEVDVYKGPLEGFYSAEVEFDSAEDMKNFDPPPWFGLEVTHRKDLSNYSIATFGLPEDIMEKFSNRKKGEK